MERCMATLCRMCGDNAGSSVSLLDTSQHHLQWAINHFGIQLDDVLPTSVCLRCDAIILDWTSFLARIEKAKSLFSTMLAINVPPSSVPGTERLQHPQVPRQRTSRPHSSKTSVPSKPSASAPDLSLPQHLVTEFHIKDFTIMMSRLRDQVLDSLQQNGTVDCNVVDSQMSEQGNVHIKLEPVTVDPCVCNDQVSDNLQQNLSSTEEDDDIEVPFEAINVPLVKCEADLVKTEPSSDLSAAQSENHHLADNTAVTVKQEELGNAEAVSDVQPDLPELETSAESSNPGSNKDVNIGALVFSCALCDFTTNCKSKITSHIVNQHVTMSRFQCQECNKSYKYKGDLNNHISHVHPNKFPYKCPLCKRGFQLEKHFNAHIKNHVKTLQCDVCGKIFGTKHALTEHKMRIHTKSSALPCDTCSKIFYTEASLKKHKRRVHSNLSFQCDICDKSFKLKTHLNGHQRGVHASVRAFSCNLCEKTFVSKSNLKAHSLVHSGLRPFKCGKCVSSFNQNAHLSKHIRTVHSNERAFNCHLCGKSFKRKSHLSRHLTTHIRTVHSNERAFNCHLCGQSFKHKSHLSRHITRHIRTVLSNERAFKCHLCDQSFKRKGDLTKHLTTHTDVRNYKCEQCGKQFKTKPVLKLHLTSHSEIRPFACAQCHKKFRTKANLVVHLRHVHSDVRPFSCDKCPYACKSKCDLTKHQFVHSNVRSFECHHCKSKFKHRQGLRVHMKTKHSVS